MTERIGAILRINAFIQSVQGGKVYLNGKQVEVVALDRTCAFEDMSEIELNDEQITNLFDQTHGKAPASAPNPARDTQFAGFAKMLWDDLSHAQYTTRHYNNMTTAEIDRHTIEKIIAQRAYDLVLYTLHITDYPDRFGVEYAMCEIPDMTAWPEANE